MRRSQKIEIPIASLIDIVFLLIVFFLVTSEFDKEIDDDSIQLADSHFIDPVTKKDPRTVTINLKRVDDTRSMITIATVPLSMNQLTDILRASVRKFGTSIPVVIRADGDLNYGEVDRLIEVLKDVGIQQIRLASKQVTMSECEPQFRVVEKT